ncbi:hypothetical protein QFC24_007079 [Naganishia onofrii]|uniref:Uncharacterized protein n=1 Tax=Naganishia onofrii TaxID=1851511 RepID=A0ACC2WU47_9TREE|nr:hypothetical protein QFC24_007079 [Naganishia onofrii]
MADVLVGNTWKRFDDDKVATIEDPCRHPAYRSKKMGKERVWTDCPVMLVYQLAEAPQPAETGVKDKRQSISDVSASTQDIESVTLSLAPKVKVPEWLENYDHTKSLSLPRLLESFDIATEEAIQSSERPIAAPSETEKGWAAFVKACDILGVGKELIIPPQSANRFGSCADNNILSEWTNLLARLAPPKEYTSSTARSMKSWGQPKELPYKLPNSLPR